MHHTGRNISIVHENAIRNHKQKRAEANGVTCPWRVRSSTGPWYSSIILTGVLHEGVPAVGADEGAIGLKSGSRKTHTRRQRSELCRRKIILRIVGDEVRKSYRRWKMQVVEDVHPVPLEHSTRVTRAAPSFVPTDARSPSCRMIGSWTFTGPRVHSRKDENITRSTRLLTVDHTLRRCPVLSILLCTLVLFVVLQHFKLPKDATACLALKQPKLSAWSIISQSSDKKPNLVARSTRRGRNNQRTFFETLD